MLTIDMIKQTVAPLAEKYDLLKIDLFGSYANGNATEQSDADFLVEFNTPTPSIFKVMGLKEELSKNLKLPVDIVTIPVPRMDILNIEEVVSIYEQS